MWYFYILMMFCIHSNINAMNKGTSKNIEQLKNTKNPLLNQSPPRDIPQKKNDQNKKNAYVIISPPDYIAFTSLSPLLENRRDSKR